MNAIIRACLLLLTILVGTNAIVLVLGQVKAARQPETKSPTVRQPQTKPKADSPVQEKRGAPEETVDRLMEQSGYKYEKAGEGVWVVYRSGKSLPYFQVVIASTSTALLVTAVVGRNTRLASDMATKLLHLADALAFVKVGLDSDNDLFVRGELRLKFLNLEELQATIEAVADGADRTALELKTGIQQTK